MPLRHLWALGPMSPVFGDDVIRDTLCRLYGLCGGGLVCVPTKAMLVFVPTSTLPPPWVPLSYLNIVLFQTSGGVTTVVSLLDKILSLSSPTRSHCWRISSIRLKADANSTRLKEGLHLQPSRRISSIHPSCPFSLLCIHKWTMEAWAQVGALRVAVGRRGFSTPRLTVRSTCGSSPG